MPETSNSAEERPYGHTVPAGLLEALRRVVSNLHPLERTPSGMTAQALLTAIDHVREGRRVLAETLLPLHYLSMRA